tara:strand:+ start:131 stop:514 length:384 start_codon:yes stop_codon:yes gene_type:complete
MKNTQNFDIQIESVEGDKLINNFIVSQLNRNKNDQSENKFDISINTIYKKIINSKDATGTTASYQLNATTELNIKKKDIYQKIIITEKFIMDKNENAFNENSYERSIKQTFASSIVRKIISKLSLMK